MLRRRPDNLLEFRLIEATFAAAGPFPLSPATRERMKTRVFARLDVQEVRQARLGFTERERWVAIPAGIGIAAAIVGAIKVVESQGDESSTQATLARSIGSVSVDGRPATQVRTGERVVANGEAWLTVGERIRINLEDESEIQLEDGTDSLQVHLHGGQATIATTEARVTVHGSNWSAEVAKNSVAEFASNSESTLVRVFEGLVMLSRDGGEVVSIQAGELPVVVPVAGQAPEESRGPKAPAEEPAGVVSSGAPSSEETQTPGWIVVQPAEPHVEKGTEPAPGAEVVSAAAPLAESVPAPAPSSASTTTKDVHPVAVQQPSAPDAAATGESTSTAASAGPTAAVEASKPAPEPVAPATIEGPSVVDEPSKVETLTAAPAVAVLVTKPEQSPPATAESSSGSESDGGGVAEGDDSPAGGQPSANGHVEPSGPPAASSQSSKSQSDKNKSESGEIGDAAGKNPGAASSEPGRGNSEQTSAEAKSDEADSDDPNADTAREEGKASQHGSADSGPDRPGSSKGPDTDGAGSKDDAGQGRPSTATEGPASRSSADGDAQHAEAPSGKSEDSAHGSPADGAQATRDADSEDSEPKAPLREVSGQSEGRGETPAQTEAPRTVPAKELKEGNGTNAQAAPKSAAAAAGTGSPNKPNRAP